MQQQAFLKYTPSTHDSAESLSRELVEIRSEGVAYDREEHDRGIISIAAPILTSNDRVVGALSIATSTSRYSLEELGKFRPQLLEVASHIGADAQSWQFPSQT
jgi:DNA-binding IclR family transcriptional regulator